VNKAELRNIYLKKAVGVPRAERERASRLIAANFCKLPRLASASVVHCFLSVDRFNEIDTSFILHAVWKHYPQVRVAVPRVDFATSQLESVLYTAASEVTANRWLISEPIAGEIVTAEKIDIVIVPLLCTDSIGHRVGYGKGFYDRFLRTVRSDCTKVGISYFPPIPAIDDVHDGDIPLDVLITPDGVNTFAH
jgi:5-formyltetrahydrofolate cyclo-ligase